MRSPLYIFVFKTIWTGDVLITIMHVRGNDASAWKENDWETFCETWKFLYLFFKTLLEREKQEHRKKRGGAVEIESTSYAANEGKNPIFFLQNFSCEKIERTHCRKEQKPLSTTPKRKRKEEATSSGYYHKRRKQSNLEISTFEEAIRQQEPPKTKKRKEIRTSKPQQQKFVQLCSVKHFPNFTNPLLHRHP